MRIRITFLLSYAILALCFGAIGYTGYILLHTTQDAFKEVVDKGIPILKALEDIRFASLRMMASTSEYGVLRADRSANNPAPEQEAEADRRKDNPNKLVVSAAQLYETAFQHYAQLIEAFFPQDRARLDLLQKADLNLKAKSAQIRILKQLGQADRELLEIQERFVDDVDAFLDIVGTLITHYTTQLEQQKLVIRMTAQSALWSLLGMSGFAILLACYTSFRLARAIAIPLEKLQQAVLPFGSGPLQPRVEISALQEIRTLAAAFDQMADALNHMTIAKKDVDNVLHSMADSLIVLDPDGTIRSVNRATLDLLGYDAESLMGHAMCLFLGDSDAHCYDERRPAPLEFFTRKVETTYRAKNGALIPVSFSGSLVQDEAGCVEGIVCVAHDTSERNRFEQEFQQDTQELQEARQVAEAASRAKSEVVSDRESGQDRASTHLDAETLHHLEALDLPGQPSLYNWVIEHFLDTTPELMSTLRRAVHDDDASELQRIAHNLKSSAGNVGALSLAERYHNLEAMGRAHNLSGAEAELDKLETFFSAACDELTRLLQSTPAAPQRVSVLPEPGLVVPCTSRGTSRRGDAACLPPCQTKKVTPTALHPSLQAVTAIDDEQPTLNVRAQSAHVLIVDDDDTVRALARRVLEQQGFTVAAVADGAQAVAAFVLTRPDMVLLDVDIPYLDGFAVLTMFRAMPDGVRVPVVMMTGLDDAASINRAYEAGATDFITKPLNQFLLPHRVRYMLRASQTEAALRESEQRFRAIFKEAAMGIAQVDLQGRIIESNFALARILGYTTDELGAGVINDLW
jgi:PAS domain S-box-containing protein